MPRTVAERYQLQHFAVTANQSTTETIQLTKSGVIMGGTEYKKSSYLCVGLDSFADACFGQILDFHISNNNVEFSCTMIETEFDSHLHAYRIVSQNSDQQIRLQHSHLIYHLPLTKQLSFSGRPYLNPRHMIYIVDN